MTPLVRRLVELAIHFDQSGMPNIAKVITEAIEEIENARHIRGAADESAKQSEHADERTGARDGD